MCATVFPRHTTSDLVHLQPSVDKDAMDYFRGIVKTGELSPRVLELTEHIIRLNPGMYSVWYVSFLTI